MKIVIYIPNEYVSRDKPLFEAISQAETDKVIKYEFYSDETEDKDNLV